MNNYSVPTHVFDLQSRCCDSAGADARLQAPDELTRQSYHNAERTQQDIPAQRRQSFYDPDVTQIKERNPGLLMALDPGLSSLKKQLALKRKFWHL